MVKDTLKEDIEMLKTIVDAKEGRALPGLPTPQKGRRLVFDEKKGTFVEGKAKPALLDPGLRALPGEFVTREIEDGAKIHELDPEHVRGSLVEEFEKAENEATRKKKPEEKLDELAANPTLLANAERFLIPGPLASLPDAVITQERVDWIRFCALRQKIKTAMDNISLGLPASQQLAWVESLQHVWFPTPDVRICEVRERKPPPDLLRPAWLKKIDLICDVQVWPRRIVDLLASGGIILPSYAQIKSDLAYEAGLQELYSVEDDAEDTIQ